jgi:hypothetical protein
MLIGVLEGQGDWEGEGIVVVRWEQRCADGGGMMKIEAVPVYFSDQCVCSINSVALSL